MIGAMRHGLRDIPDLVCLVCKSSLLTPVWYEMCTARSVATPFPVCRIGGCRDVTNTVYLYRHMHAFATKDFSPPCAWVVCACQIYIARSQFVSGFGRRLTWGSRALWFALCILENQDSFQAGACIDVSPADCTPHDAFPAIPLVAYRSARSTCCVTSAVRVYPLSWRGKLGAATTQDGILNNFGPQLIALDYAFMCSSVKRHIG